MALEGCVSRPRASRVGRVFEILKRSSQEIHPRNGPRRSRRFRPPDRPPARHRVRRPRRASAATIVIDGETLPYRPVAAIAFRGSQGHINSVYNFLAVDLLNQLVGASADMVGGCLGFNPGVPRPSRHRPAALLRAQPRSRTG